MPISEDHPAYGAVSEKVMDEFFDHWPSQECITGEREPALPEDIDLDTFRRCFVAALNAALPNLKPEDVPGVRNALLDDLIGAAERETNPSHGVVVIGTPSAALQWLRQQKEPRDV